MSTQNHSELSRKMNRQALRLFGTLAFVTYSIALAYCYFTNRPFEVGVMGTIMLLLGVLIVYLYASAGEKGKEHKLESSFKDTAQNLN